MNDFAKVDKIFGCIHVSGYEGAKDFDGRVVFVHHDIQWYTKGYHIPVLKVRPNSDTDRSGAKVNTENLNLLVDIIDEHFLNRWPLLVHCRGGVERSPLTVVAWLVQRKKMDIDEAYEFVKFKRPVVEDRRMWLENGE